MDERNQKSVERNRKTVTSLADILTKEGLSIIMPGGGLAYDFAKTLFQHTKSWYEDRRDRRLEEFHESLLEGIPEEHKEDFLKSEFSPEDYYSLINNVLQDEEDQKVEIYSKLFSGLQLDLIPKKFRRHLIKCSRELKCSDFELMRLIYINAKYEFEAPGNKINQIRSITMHMSDDPMKAYSIQTLIRLGFLSDSHENKPPWPTTLLTSIVEFLYDENDLTPESLGKKARTGKTGMIKVFIACDALGNDQYSRILAKLADRLQKEDIKNIIANPVRRSFPLLFAKIIVICVSPKSNLMDNIKKFVDINKKIIVEILLPGAGREELPFLDAPVFDFTSEKPHQLTDFINLIRTKLV